jgi:NAD(P)-dependent dehydrogenase (short-subunit alcohol dehydrogenase family)
MDELMKGRTCVITGATSGIGRAAAFELGVRGANLVLVGRNEDRGKEIVARVLRRAPASTVQFFRCDLTVRSEVLDVAKVIREKFGSIDVLVNNAGARFDTFAANPDGVERTFAGNHLGHFLLTALLLDSLLKSPAARVVTLGSSAHGVTPPDGWILTEGNYDRKLAYGSSKLANIIFAYELARRLAKTQVTVNALDPGGVATRLGLNNGLVAWLKHLVYYLMKGQLLSPKRASAGVVFLATSPEVRGKSGGYYFGNSLMGSSTISHDLAVAQALWTLSVERSRIDPEIVGNMWKYIAP